MPVLKESERRNQRVVEQMITYYKEVVRYSLNHMVGYGYGYGRARWDGLEE